MKRIFFTIILGCFIIYLFRTGIPLITFSNAYSHFGSKSTEVFNIQTRLKKWGYYSGPVDSKYGYLTYKAVKYFQSKNGLTADGICGTKTLSALGLDPGKTSTNSNATTTASTSSGSKTTSRSGYDRNEDLLAHLIHGEARGEPYIGKVAVAAVVINRTSDSRFPRTISGVIYQKGAFDAVSDGQFNLTPDSSDLNAARDAINGWDPSQGCIYYFNPKTATSKWIWSRPIVVTIGNHVFAK